MCENFLVFVVPKATTLSPFIPVYRDTIATVCKKGRNDLTSEEIRCDPMFLRN